MKTTVGNKYEKLINAFYYFLFFLMKLTNYKKCLPDLKYVRYDILSIYLKKNAFVIFVENYILFMFSGCFSYSSSTIRDVSVKYYFYKIEKLQ